MDILEEIFSAAKKHGESGEPDMEVGDLQQLARDLWAILTPAQRKSFRTSPGPIIDWTEFVDNWTAKDGCKLCGKEPAYAGAIYCGAACCARYEAGER